MSPVTRQSKRTRGTANTMSNKTTKKISLKNVTAGTPAARILMKNVVVLSKTKTLKSAYKQIKIELEKPSVHLSPKNESKLKFDSVTMRGSDENFDVLCIPEFPDIRIKISKHPYSCSKCNAGFRTKKAYDAHAPIHVPRTPKPPVKRFRCDVCAMEFSKMCNIERHKRVHTGEKPFVCSICNMRFQQAHNLSKHLLTHLHIKPFHCRVCDMQFGRRDILARHQLTHSKIKPIKCWACHKRFIRQSQLMQHHRKCHPDQLLIKLEEVA